MNKPSAVQVRPGQSHGMTGSSSGLLSRQHTLGSHISVQREAAGPGIDSRAPALVRDVLGSPGHPLDASTRASMEPRFGYDFSQVRVHTDERAAESARAVSANAYTAGNHVAFAAGKYAPETQGGQRLMAHELTHVVQQATGPVGGTQFAPGLFVSHPADSLERKAATLSPVERAAPGTTLAKPASTEAHLQRQTPQQPDAKLANEGAVAGIAGAVAGALSLGLAAVAYFRPPEALNPAPVTGGFSINPNPFSFNTVAQTAAMPGVTPIKEPPSHRAKFLQAQRGAPTTHPVLDLRTDDKNHVLLNVIERHDDINIIDASVRTSTTENYLGGSRGSSAVVNFSAFQTPPLVKDGLFSGDETGAAKETAAPAAATPEPGEITVTYTGTNSKDQGAPQNFTGTFTVKGDGSVDVADPEITNGVGRAQKSANVAFVDYRGSSGKSSGESGHSAGPSLVSPAGGGDKGGGFDPGQLLPINKPMT